MDVKAIQARLAAHAVERNWDPFFSPRSLSMAVAGEAGALLAKLQWLSEDQARRLGQTQERDAVADSIADVVLYALRLADTVEIDLEEAVLARAAAKYPVSARRFEGVDDMDSPASAPVPAETLRPRLSTSAGANPASPRAEPDADRTMSRAAAARDEPARPVPPAPVRPQPARTVDDDPEQDVRGADARSREGATARPAARSEPPSRGRPEPASRERTEPPARERSVPPPRARSEPPAGERADPPVRERAAPSSRVEPPPRAERYANLDTDAVLEMMKGLKRRIDDSRSDDTILHEIKDEMDTLRRNVYSSKSKPAWIAGGLERLRALLEEAASHPVGDKVNFKDYIGRIGSMLEQ
jgi:dCTP diphosphatase